MILISQLDQLGTRLPHGLAPVTSSVRSQKNMLYSVLSIVLFAFVSTAMGETLNDRAVVTTAQRTGVSQERVRQAATTGCEADMFSMSLCAEYQFVLVDQNMSDVYKRLLVSYSEEPASLLINSQRAWIGFRNQACTFESSGLDGGSAHGYSELRCMSEKTKIRFKELQGYKACTQGGCPGPRK